MTGSVLSRRLAGLHRDEQGRPVPYITLWRGGPARGAVQDPEWGWLERCNCVAGSEEAFPGLMCYDRQREAIQGQLCQMCGHGFDGSPFWFLTTASTIYHRDPAWHAACGRWAFSVCPGLLSIREGTADPFRRETLIARCWSYGVTAHLSGEIRRCVGRPVMVSERVTATRSRELATERMAVRWLYAELDSPEIFTVSDWLASTGKD